MIDALFIAGTDTEVGKTVVSKAILQALAAQDLSTIGYKPVAAGSEKYPEGLRNSDALHLQEAATQDIAYEDVNPYALLLPSSPHIAAKHDGVVIDETVLSAKLAEHKQNSDIVLVEGAGGWRLPLNNSEYLSDFVSAQNSEVIVVVGMKLGCLNHALLTIEAI